MFDKDEDEFSVCCHGNLKKLVPYKRTAHSIIENLKHVSDVKKPAEAMKDVRRQEDGRLASNMNGLLPCNSKQAHNLKYNAPKSNVSTAFGDVKDTLADMMEKCKRTMNKPGKAFIWQVERAPEPMCIISTESTFCDLERFCCNAPQGLHFILTIDPAFELGEFSFTPTTDRNLAVLDAKTCESKLQMGPALIHYRKKFHSYHYFTTSLVGIKPNLSDLKSFGTDGESNLIMACEKTWPFADSV